jgi:FtsP/CotA-like multicopper oxidase with cupredoxin domain
MGGLHKHTFHLHSIHYQLGGVSDPTGFFQTGDWQDVIKLPHHPYVDMQALYFSVDHWSKLVAHCHFLSHEDTGCMG